MNLKTTTRLQNDYPVIWQSVKTNPRGRASGKDLSKFGSIALIYECAGYGGMGKVNEIERVKIYEFYNYIAFCRTRDDTENN